MRRSVLILLFAVLAVVRSSDLATAGSPAYEQSLIERVSAAFSPREGIETPDDSPIHPVRCGTPLMSEIKHAWPNLSEETKQVLSAHVAEDRPVRSEFYDTPDGRFRIHYDRTGIDSVDMSHGVGEGNVPVYVLTCADLLDTVVAREVDQMGFPFPLHDSIGTPGEDPRYDIYFTNLRTTFYGLSVPGVLVQSQGEPSLWQTSWIVLHSDFRQIPPYRFNPFNGMAVTLAHEFHHASHWTYDAFEAEIRSDSAFPWFLEASATAMEDVVFDEVNDYYAYLESFASFPWVSLRHFSFNFADVRSNHPYASAIWMLYLVQQHGEEIIREIWEVCGETPGFNTFEAFETALNAHGSTFAEAWAEFLVWNYFTGDRATDWSFDESEQYPGLRESHVVSYFDFPVEDSASIISFPRPIDELAAQYLLFTPVLSDTSTTFRMQFTPSDGFEEWMIVTAGLIEGVEPRIQFTRDVLNPVEFQDWDLFEQLLVVVSPFKENPQQEEVSRNLGYRFEIMDSVPPSTAGAGVRKVFPNPLVLSGGAEETAFTVQVARTEEVEISMHIYTTDGRLIRGGEQDSDGSSNVLYASPAATNKLLKWNGQNRDNQYVATGVYLALVQVGGKKEIVKVAIKNSMK